MVKLTNKRTIYSISNENEKMGLTGQVTISDEGRITDFNGQFQNADKNYAGSFYYNENDANKANKNLNDVDVTISKDACDLLDATIAELKTKND